MPSLKGSDILQLLSPMNPNPLIGWTLYIIIVLVLATMFMQKEGNNTITIMLFTVIIACLIDKVISFRPNTPGVAAFRPNLIGSFMLRVIIFVFPIIVAGMTREKSSKARGPAIFASIIAAFYLFGRWFFEQRPQ